jgi:outer membrane protein, heavy metal efflux system
MERYYWRGMKIKILGLLCLFMIFKKADAQVLTLDSVLSSIKQHNPVLSGFDARIRAMDFYAKGARSFDPPQVGGGLWMTPYNFQPGMGYLQLSAQQMITNTRKLDVKENYMKSLSATESANKNFTLNDLYARAKALYYDWMLLKYKEKILKKNIDLAAFMVKLSESRYPQGQEKLSNIYKAKAELFTMQDMLIGMKSMEKEKNIMLNALMNIDKNKTYDIDTTYSIKNYEQGIEDSTSLMKKSDIQSVDRSIEIMKLNQQVEKNMRLPDFGIRYDHMSPFGADQPAQFNLMAMVTVPIAPWSSKEYKTKIEGMDYEILGLQQQRKEIINESRGEVASLQSRIISKKEQLKLYTTQLSPALQAAYESSLTAYQQNTEDAYSVLTALENMNKANMDYYDRLLELLQLQVEYEKVLEIK